MQEILRPRRVLSLTLHCFRCGATQEMEDDGRRVEQANVHTASCSDRPPENILANLALASPDHLEMRLEDGAVWFEIRRSIRRSSPVVVKK